jgi:hypothetical protein
MANSQFLEYQDTDNSGLIDACDDLANVPEQKTCPPCQKNINYIAPDWKTKNADEPWLNEKLCKYQITIVTTERTLIPTADATADEANEYVNEIFQSYEEEAIDGILSYFEKDNTEQNINNLKNFIDYEKYDLDIRKNSRVKLLFSIPYENVASLMDVQEDDDDQEQEEQQDLNERSTIVVSYDAAELNSNILKVRKALNLYGKYLKVFRATNSINIVYENDNRIFNLKRYGDNGIYGRGVLESVINDIDNFLNKKGYRLRGGAISGFLKDVVNEIEFSFTSEYKLKRIAITTRDCGDKQIVFNSKKIKPLTRKGNFKDSTAMAYLARIDDMVSDITAREPPNWSDFVVQHTFPSVILLENWPFSGESDEATSISCIGEALLSEAKQLGQDVIDKDFDLVDSVLYTFNKNLCKDDLAALNLENIKLGLVEDPSTMSFDDNRVNENEGTIFALAKEQAFKELELEGEVFLTACFKMLNNGDEKNAQPSSLKEMFENLFDRLKLCGLKDLLTESASCLMGGLSFEAALASVIRSALLNMSIYNFGKMFDFLPPEDQQEIQNLIQQKLDSSDIFKEGSINERVSDYINAGVDPGLITNLRPWEDEEFISEIKSAGQQTLNGIKNTTQTLSATKINNNTRTLAQRFDQNLAAARNNNGMILELYVVLILEHYSNDLFSVLEVLNRFPGSQLVAKSLLLFDCPQPPLFEPSVLDFVRDVELPFCKGIDDITFPILRNPLEWVPRIKDITGEMPEILKVNLQKVLISALSRLMVKVCNILGSASCNSLKATGSAIGNWADINNREAIVNTIREAICGPNASQQQVESTVIDMFEKLGLGAAALADTEKLLQFTGDMSDSLTRGEMVNFFLGNPTSESLTVLDQLIEADYPEYRSALPSEDAIADFGQNMGVLMPVDFRDNLQNFIDELPEDDSLPANVSLCASTEDLENFCTFRAELLADRASEEQAAQMCENEQDDILEKLDDITNALQQGPSEMMANSLQSTPILSDPGCENGIVPFQPAVVTNAVNKSMDFTLKQIFVDFSTDMLGNGPGEKNWGMINMILSDTLGIPLTAHYRRVSNRRNYVDFVTDDSNVENQEGQFPLYVGEWMRDQLEGLSIAFNSNNDYQEKEFLKEKPFSEIPGVGLYGSLNILELPDAGYKTEPVVDYQTETLQYIREGRKGTPDLALEFRDNNKGKVTWEGSTFVYGFDLQLFLSDLTQEKTDDGELVVRNIPADTARINIDDLLNFGADITKADRKQMTKEEKKQIRSILKTPSIQKERKFEFLAVDDTFDLLTLQNQYPTFVQSFNVKSDYAPQLILLNEMLAENGYSGTTEELKDYYNSTLDVIYAKITEEVKDNEDGFLYGAQYDNLAEEDVEYVVQDGQTDSPGGTLYSDATINGEPITNDDAILGISRNQFEATNTEDIRVFYLDPGQFGGSYVNPPVYIKPQQNKGWLGIIDIMFPELSPCKPSLTDLIDFGQISEQVQKTYDSVPMDERLKFDEDCAVELPYNRILERESIAGIQGVIVSACRIFSSVHFIKSLATFTTFKPDFNDVFSSIYPQYIVENMEMSFKDVQNAAWERLNPFKDEEFWYAFLEQSVQTYSRLVDDGTIIDPPSSVLQAMFRINDMQEGYDFPTKEDWKASQDLTSDLGKAFLASAVGVPGAGLASFAANFETYTEYKERLNFEAIKASEEDAKLVLKEMVKIELQYMADKFIENLKTMDIEPKYTDVDYFILTQFTAGGIDLDLDKEIVAVEEEEPSGPSFGTTSNVANHVHAYEVDENGNGWAWTAYHPTDSRIKHKHQIINWEVQVAQSDCYPDCKEIYGNDGLGPHNHNISRMIVPIGDVQSYDYIPSSEQVSEVGKLAIDAAIEVVNTAEEALNLDITNETLQQAYETALEALNSVLDTFGIDLEQYFSSQKPFVIEKYISINGVKYSIDEGTEIIKSNSPTLNLSDVYPGTLEHVFEPKQITQEDENSIGVRVSPLENDPSNKIIGLKGQLGVRHGLQFSSQINGQKYEITSVEMDALDYEIQTFVPVQANSKELLCLLNMLKEDQKFRLVSRYVVPVNKLLSTMAIYNDMAFLNSIGEVTVDTGEYEGSGATFQSKPGIKVTFDDDGNISYADSKEGWASADDRNPGFLGGLAVREWDNWDQELLRNSKSRIKSLFKGFYNSRDFDTSFDRLFDFDPVEFSVQTLKNRVRPNLSRQLLPKWRKKRTRTNPFNSEGTICKNQGS